MFLRKMKSPVKYIPVLCLVCILTLPYASTTKSSRKKAYTLCHSSVQLEKCSEKEPCKDRSGEDNLNAVCQYGCSPNQSLRCNEQDGVYLRFCYDNKDCPAGTHDTADHVDGLDDKIILIQEECPEGYFQPHPTQCDKACRSYRHVPLPSYMVQLYPGNASASEVAYCDSKSGWVSFNGQTFFNISMEQGSRMCDVSRSKCQNEMDLLPNGTCAAACRPGHHRVPGDHFNCRETNTMRDVSTSPMSEPDDDAKDSGIGPSYQSNIDQKTSVIAIVCSVFACTGIGIGVGVVYVRRRRGKSKEESHTSGEEGAQMLEQDVSGGNNDPQLGQNTESHTSGEEGAQMLAPVKITKKEEHNIRNGDTLNVEGDNNIIYYSGNQ